MALAPTSCAASVPHPPYSAQPTSALVAIALPPPPGRIEAIPKRPPTASAWIDGEWLLQHGRWYWLLGRWVKVPAGATYSPWVVVRAADGTTFYAASTWRDATGAPLPGPPALATATASGEAVVSAEGDTEDTGRNIKTAPAKRAAWPEESPP